jgi:hypothetical protein
MAYDVEPYVSTITRGWFWTKRLATTGYWCSTTSRAIRAAASGPMARDGTGSLTKPRPKGKRYHFSFLIPISFTRRVNVSILWMN